MSCSCTPESMDRECAYLASCLAGAAQLRAAVWARTATFAVDAADIRAAAAERVRDLASCARVRAELADAFGVHAALELAGRLIAPRH